MDYIILDLEWNQPSTKEELIKFPDPLYGEIIQVGAVKMNKDKQITGTFNQIVSPVYYTKMHSKVEQITGIDEEKLESGRPFPVVFEELLDFCGDEFCFLTWGRDDIRMVRSNMKIHGMTVEPFFACYNAQWIYGRQMAKTAKQVSLAVAVETLGEPPYKAHDAFNDAMSTALVCRHLDLESGIEECRIKSRKEKSVAGKKKIRHRRHRKTSAGEKSSEQKATK